MKQLSLKRFRTMGFFIEAAIEIIQTEGLEGVTIRKVADKAGYNSATIYEYFENLNHLIYMAALQCMAPYIVNAREEAEYAKNAYEKYLRVWEVFCRHSFKEPKLYNAIFFTEVDDDKLQQYIEEYYELYRQKREKENSFERVLREHDIVKRNYVMVQDIALEGFIDSEDVDSVNDLSLLIYKGMLEKVINHKGKVDVERYVEMTMDYLNRCCSTYLKKTF